MNLRFADESALIAALQAIYARVGSPQAITDASGSPVVEAGLAFKEIVVFDPGLPGAYNTKVKYLEDTSTGQVLRVGGREREEFKNQVVAYLDGLGSFVTGMYEFYDIQIEDNRAFAKLIAHEVVSTNPRQVAEKNVTVYRRANGSLIDAEITTTVTLTRPTQL